jgi:hypothetical protein
MLRLAGYWTNAGKGIGLGKKKLAGGQANIETCPRPGSELLVFLQLLIEQPSRHTRATRIHQVNRLRHIPTLHINTMSGPLLLSFLFPLLAVAQNAGGSELPPPGYNGGYDNPQDPSDAGAEGASKGAFSLSSGALTAIIVVCVVVVLGGSMLTPFRLKVLELTPPQSAQQHYGGSQRRSNGMSEHPSVVPPAALPVAVLPTTASKITRTEEPASVSTRRPRARTPTR